MARLVKSWTRAQAGTLATGGVVFRGEPGIGKSRLAAAATELVEGSGAVVLELVGSALHTDTGLHPIRTLLQRRCGIGRSTGPAERLTLLRAEIAAVGLDPVAAVPLLAPVLGIAADDGYEPVPAAGRKLYELINEAVLQYLMACVGDAAGWWWPRTCTGSIVHPRGARRFARGGPERHSGAGHREAGRLAARQLAGQGG